MKLMKNKHIIVVSTLFLLSNCSLIAPPSMQSSLQYLGYAKGAVDTVSYVKTGKTSTDHIVSAFIGKDCKISRVIRKKTICVEFDPKVFKYKIFNTKGREVSSNNIIKMQFPSEIYDFNKTLEKDLQKKLKKNKVKTPKNNNIPF